MKNPFRAAAPALRPVAFAIALAAPLSTALLFGLPAPAHAQAASVQRFDLPAGPLDATLTRIARQAGRMIVIEPHLVSGLRAGAIHGELTPEQAFSQALAGSGLSLETRSSGTLGLRKQEEGATLAPVTVTAQGDRGTTEGSGSYTTGAMNTATGLNLAPRETPQSVSVLTRQQIEDQNLTSLDDALQNITGVVVQKGYYVGDSGSFSARGFPVSNILLDGLPTSTGANGTFNADNDALDIYDRVEVVRGATGLTSGTGKPSATINLVRKRPTAERQGTLTFSAGSWDNYRATIDLSGPINGAGTLRGRTVITAQDSDKYYDTAHDRNHQFYGILEADLTPDTVATLGYHYRKVDNDGTLPGMPTNPDGSFLSGLKRSTNLSNDFDYWKQTDHTVFAELTHRFTNGWQVKASAIWKRPEQDLMFSGLGRTAGVLRQNTQRYRLDNEHNGYDLSLNGPFSLLGRDHELMLGASYQKRENNNWGGWAAYSWTAGAPQVDPYHWDSSSVSKPDIDMSRWSQINTVRQKGLYAATRLNLADPLKLILGTRLSWYEREQGGGHGTDFKVAREITPYAGIVYDVNEQHSVYASWTKIFEPQGHYDRSGNLIDPITGTNYEVGVKGEYFHGRLNASLAAFLVQQQNRATDDRSGPSPCPGTTATFCQRASGEVESRGIELEVSGALTPDWQIMAGYTWVAAKYTKDIERSNVGKLFDPDLPRHQLKLSTQYRLPGSLNRWRVGGNLYAQNAIKSGDDSNIRQSGYAVVGLNAAYSLTPQTDVRLNVHNVLDKHYYQNVGWSNGGNVFGTPRNFMLTLSHRL